MSDQPLLISQLAPVFSAAFIYASTRFSIKNKQLDIVAGFHQRYDQLQVKRTEILVEQARVGEPGAWSPKRLEVEAVLFFDRFWSLQFDEYVAWYDGYVPTSTYVHWLYARRRELQNPGDNWTLHGETLGSSFTRVEKLWARNLDSGSKETKRLSEFVQLVRELKLSVPVDVEKAIRKVGPGKWVRGRRWSFGAY